ncbi:MAG: flagellar filament capping protein FliD [Anaerovibrio sp.]|uniref:flagellar filament capping protein FliD n=1 Tax=Anaerovibrio sp. TaxID=1872532 RepID=UPI0025E80B40|nr:flagellar filament capping protein FliD [Anaerovibrio sp.]MCR5177095.1 flagellar filament capping protein FliD [Anaerovibrio sp.]
MAITVSSMAKDNYSFYQLAKDQGISLSGSKTSDVNSSSDISTMWNAYTNKQSTSTFSGFNAEDLYGVQKGYRELLSSYQDTRKEFNAELKANMSDLSKSARTLAATDFNVGEDALIQKEVTTTDKDGKTTTETQTVMNDALQTAVKNIKDFVSDYNDSVGFFKENAAISNRMSRMNDMFSDTTYRAGNYQSIGISVGKDGSLTVDDDRLVNAITSSPDKVSRILGNEGLVGKTQSHINTVNSQQDKLFPSVESLFGDDLKTARVYTGNALLAMNGYANMGNFVSMYW